MTTTAPDYAHLAHTYADRAADALNLGPSDKVRDLIDLATIYTDLAKLTPRTATVVARTPYRQAIPAGTLIAYPNLSGALVTVTQTGTGTGVPTYPWNCTACPAGADTGFSNLAHSKDTAEKHAAKCTAIHIPTTA